ncbi:MFS transporter [Chloroflexota bacterium]
MKKFEFRSLFSGLVPLFVLAHFAHHLLTALPTPILPFIREEFSLDYTRSGLVSSAFSLAYGIGQLPAGWLADRYGARIMITIGICGVALAGVLVGFSHTYIMMICFLVLMGVTAGGYHPSAPPLISSSVEPKNRNRSLGLHAVGGSASFFLVPLIGAAIASSWGWRYSFIGLAIPTMIFGIILFSVLGRSAPPDKAESGITDINGNISSHSSRWRNLVSFMSLSFSTQAVSFSLMPFIVLYMVDYFGLSKETAASFIALTYSCGLWAGPLGGFLADHYGRISVLLVVCFCAGPVIYLFNLVPYGFGFAVLLIALGVILYIRLPISESYLISHTEPHNRSTILGIYYFASMEGSGIITPVFGYITDKFGFHTMFTIAGISLFVVTLICAFFLRGSKD